MSVEDLLKEIKELNMKVDLFIKNEDIKGENKNVVIEEPKSVHEILNKIKDNIKKDDAKKDDDTSVTESDCISESNIDFFPVRYRTININLLEDNIIIDKATKIIKINFK